MMILSQLKKLNYNPNLSEANYRLLFSVLLIIKTTVLRFHRMMLQWKIR